LVGPLAAAKALLSVDRFTVAAESPSGIVVFVLKRELDIKKLELLAEPQYTL
jgi:hypothetical protein